jgi:hypothetical protein
LRIAVGTVVGALPDLEQELQLDIRDPEVKKAELEERTPRVLGLRRLLSEMILGPARLIRDHLSEMTYIGPLREIPLRSYRGASDAGRSTLGDRPRRLGPSIHGPQGRTFGGSQSLALR